jgi:hypothetical protein
MEIETLLDFLTRIYYALGGNGYSLGLNAADLFILKLLNFHLSGVPPLLCIFKEVNRSVRSL